MGLEGLKIIMRERGFTSESLAEKSGVPKSVLEKVVYRKTKRASKNGSGGDMQLTVFPKLPSL